MKGTSFLILSAFAILVNGQFLNSTRKRINEEAKNATWHTIDLPLDHFNVLDTQTFSARYITNDQFYKKGGPIIVYIGGEWEIEDYGVLGGVAFQLAKRHNGYLFYPEHRYFGKSLPFSRPVTTENLKYLTPDYSLADLAYSLTHIKTTVSGLKDSQVVVAGGSYAGALAVWARLKYPHIIDMAYACGGVTETTTFNTNYYNVNFRSIKKINLQCSQIIRSGIAKAHSMMNTEKGKAQLYKLFPDLVCEHTEPILDLPTRILNNFNAQVWPVYKIHKVCNHLVTQTKGHLVERLAQTAKEFAEPNNSKCNSSVDREWFFLACTFLGNLQITNASNYGNLVTAEAKLEQTCLRLFGNTFHQYFVNKQTYRTRTLFGGITPDVTKVLSVQGTHDPWYPNAIQDDLNDQTPVVYIEDSNHCLEIGEQQDDETPQVTQSKSEILQLLAKWIK